MVTEYFKQKSLVPESSLKKHARVLKWIIRRADSTFELPPVVYRNKGFYQNQFLSVEELGKIIAFLEDQYHGLALIMAYTGLDLSDALNLRWSNISMNEGMIRIVRGKTQVRISIPISAVAWDVLKFKNRVRRLHDDRLFIFTGRAFQKAWKRAVQKAGISWNVRVKDLRHFFASHLLNEGVDHLTVATLMGHSSVEMLKERYGHFGDERLRKAIDVFNQCAQSVHKPKVGSS